MARIGLNIDVSGLTGTLIIRWVKASAPLAEVGRSAAFAFPYSAVYTINDINRVVYIVQLWRSDDGVALSQLIKDWSIDASMVNVAIFRTYQYQVGRGWTNLTPVVTGTEVWADPGDTDNTLVDERLNGIAQEDMIVHQSGYGRLLDSEYTLLAGGGIVLADSKTFDQDVAWSITVSTIDTISIGGGPGAIGGQYEGVEVLTTDQDFDGTPDLANKLVIANWAGSVGTVTYPDLTLISDGTHVTYNTHSGSQNYLTHQFDAGDTVRFQNQDVNVIHQPKNTVLSFYFFEGICYVTTPTDWMLRRGRVMIDYDNSRASDTLACLLANGTLTAELLASDYPGLYAFIAALPSGFVPLGTSVGQFDYDSGGGVFPNRRFFGLRTTGTPAFKVPNLTGMVIKFGSTPGTYQADAVGPLSLEIRDGSGGSSTGTIVNTGFSGQDNPSSWTANGAAGAEKYIRNTGASETTVKNFQQIPYIIL